MLRIGVGGSVHDLSYYSIGAAVWDGARIFIISRWFVNPNLGGVGFGIGLGVDSCL